MELWETIPESEGRYEVSNHGRVRNKRTRQVLKPRQIPTGYGRVHIMFGSKRRDVYIHRLVADAFCKRAQGCDVVNHIDNDPSNNNANNLEWTTQRGNSLYAMKQGRVSIFPNAVSVVGNKDGNEIVFRTAHEAEEYTGCDHSTIIKCCKGVKHQTHGFTWRYAEVAI